MRGLPDDALVRTTPEQRSQEKWTVEMELLAQVVEEVSVLASDRRRKKPVQVPRPDHLTRKGRPDRPAEDNVVSMAGYKHAIGVLGASSKGRATVVTPDG